MLVFTYTLPYDLDHIQENKEPGVDWQALTTQHAALHAAPIQLRHLAERRPLPAGVSLFHLGDRPQHIFFIITGEVRLMRHSPQGQEMILQRARAGFIAEASLDATRYHCSAVAACPSEILAFPLQGFKAALCDDQDFHRAWSSHLAGELRRLRAKCERLSLHTAAERILHYLATEGEGGALTLTQSRKAWAAELGLSHEALYRTLRKLQDEGVLEVAATRITLIQTPIGC